jgi:archaetidylinositol phosphate synthase
LIIRQGNEKEMLDTIKDYIRTLLRPLAKKIIGVNPNTITFLGLSLSLVSAVFFARREVLTAGIVLLAGGFLDAFDGAVARENNRITKYGGFLDSVCDRFADSGVIIGAMYGGLAVFSPFPEWFVGTLAIVGSLMVSYTRARAEAAGANASVGIGDRPVRVSIIIIGAFLDKVSWAILLVAILSFITVFQRIAYVKKILK